MKTQHDQKLEKMILVSNSLVELDYKSRQDLDSRLVGVLVVSLEYLLDNLT